MDQFGNIDDYSFIDAYINRSLVDFNKKLFGAYDDKTGYFEEQEPEKDNENETVDVDTPNEDNTPEEDGPESMAYDDIYSFLFGENSPMPQYSAPYEQPSGETVDAAGIRSSGEFGNQNVGQRGKEIYTQMSSFLGYNPVANSIYRSKEQNDRLIAQGKPASKNSYHLTGNAVDFKPADWNKLSPEQKRYMKANYDVIYHDNHYHVEPKQAGGTAVANTPMQQYVGLNNDALETLFMPLQGQNPIRGLDSGEPVYVQDQTGKSDILYGPDDVIHMTGGVYEKRLSKKYKTK